MSLPDLPYNIAVLSLFITIVLTLFFLITKKGGKAANIILAIFLLLFGVQVFYSFTISDPVYTYFLGWHKPLFLLRQTALLTGPLIYFYTLTYLIKFEIRLTQLLHAIPFVGMILFLILYNSGPGNFIIWLSPLDLYTTIIILLVNLSYILSSILKLESYKLSIAEWFYSLKKNSHLSWIQYILFSFIILWILNLNISAIWMIIQKPEWCAYTRSIYTLTVFIFLGSILFILMLQPAIYYLPAKYKSATVDEETKAMYKKVLDDYMRLDKPYLNPDVTMEKVAKDISLNTRILSQIINESFNNNFNGYINDFRIQESLNQLSDNRNTKTILEILYDSGFNSKSAFYSEFKKHTTLTPQEYRNKCRMEQSNLSN